MLKLNSPPFGLKSWLVEIPTSMESIPLQVILEDQGGRDKLSPERAKDQRQSRRSIVSYDYFDPVGTQNLADRLRRVSRNSLPVSPGPADSQDTLQPSGNEDGFDLEKTMRDMIRQGDLADVKSRRLGVSFEGLRVVGLGANASYQETLGSLLNPINILSKIHTLRHPPLRDILFGFDGVVRSGDMLLVLGNPGSGCSTFLKTVTNQRSEYHLVEGEVHYDSLSSQTLAKHFRGDVQYCPEDDIHFPTLTVDQTLKFAAKTRVPHKRPWAGSSREEYIEVMTDILMTVFGLRHTKDTFVGDASIRGVSGGEKKRVSIAEALATRSRIAAWDNSTRGLDASTALEFGRALRIATDMGHMATLVSIYQASESLYQLFDKVCVIYEGRMAYFGPADQAKQYFIDMGYKPANRQTTPDFLVSVTDADSRILNDAPNMFHQPRPQTAQEFAEYFLKSPMGQQNRDDIELYKTVYVNSSTIEEEYRESVEQEHHKHTRPTSAYLISIPMQVRAVMQRRVHILMGDKAATIINFVGFLINAVIVGTVFLRLKNESTSFFSRGGTLYFTLLFSSISSMAEIPALFSQRPIVARHQKAAMYHPMIESMALTLVDIPITLATISLFGTVIYFLVNLQSTAKQFFIFILFVNTISLLMKAIYRCLAAATNAEATAMTLAGVMTLAITVYTGYAIPDPSMIGALKWISTINPLRYGFEAILANEMHTVKAQCVTFVPSGPGYEGTSPLNQVCAVAGSVAGELYTNGNAYLKLSFGYSYDNLWKNFGIIAGFLGGFLVVQLGFSEINTSLSTDSTTTLYKRGGRPAPEQTRRADEEFGLTPQPARMELDAPVVIQSSSITVPKSTDVFSWYQLQYTVNVAGEERILLDNVMGYVAPGKLTALMGTSGAGKTTLLNVLAQRTTSGVVSGDRFVNGQTLPNDFQSQTGYCQQMDIHTATDTVREALLNSAKLRQPASVPLAEKEAYVEECLRLCGLESYANAIVGSLGVEHRKRTTIGVELAAKPKLLLFLDEPTSGLDSKSSWAIIKFLQDLAQNGQAILCTIHQPSAELFQAFDRLLLLKKGGKMVYFGDLGDNAATLIRYFERNGSRHCEVSENPAEFMLDVIGAGATAASQKDWPTTWNESPEKVAVEEEIHLIYSQGSSTRPVASEIKGEFATSWMNQFNVLFARENRFRWRNTTYLQAKIMLNIVTGLFIGFTFYKTDNSQQGSANKLFAVFLPLIGCTTFINQLSVETIRARSVYETRERPSRMYHWSAFLTAHFLSEIFWNTLGSIFLFLCWYWTAGFPSSRAGYAFLAIGVMYPAFYTSIGVTIAISSPTAQVASILTTFVVVFVLLFNGVMQPFSLLGWWKWMYHVTPFTYLVEGLVTNVMGGGLSMKCVDQEFVQVDPPSGQNCGQYFQTFIDRAGGYLRDANASASCQFCPYDDADRFLQERFHMSYSHRWRNIGFFCAYLVLNVCAMYVFMYLLRIRRR